MKIVKSYNKNQGITYVYEVLESKWDPVKKMPVSRRRMIGHIDEATGEIVPNGPRGRKKKDPADTLATSAPAQSYSPASSDSELQALYQKAQQRISDQEAEISALKAEVSDLRSRLTSISSLADLS